MSKRAKHLIAACLVPILILIGMTVTPIYTLVSGEEITLRTVPIDPTDLFRGDYVALRYEAEEVPGRLVEKAVRQKFETEYSGIDVYVPLKRQGDVYMPSSVTLEKPESDLYLKGKLNYIEGSWNGTAEGAEVAHISYSLDKYFVEDNTGMELEEASRNGNILAKVKVKNGYAYLTDLVIME